jgi:ABC-type sugar transport system ATPase subunit
VAGDRAESLDLPPINQPVQQGVAILMVSSELPEILGMSDRIMVIGGGRVQGFLNREEAT